jgi:hypothetical protein
MDNEEIHEFAEETAKGFKCSCGKLFRTDYELSSHIDKPIIYTQEDLDEEIQKARADEREYLLKLLDNIDKDVLIETPAEIVVAKLIVEYLRYKLDALNKK